MLIYVNQVVRTQNKINISLDTIFSYKKLLVNLLYHPIYKHKLHKNKEEL